MKYNKVESQGNFLAIKLTCSSSNVGSGQTPFPHSRTSWHFLSYSGCNGYIEKSFPCLCIEFAYYTENFGSKPACYLCVCIAFNIWTESLAADKTQT